MGIVLNALSLKSPSDQQEREKHKLPILVEGGQRRGFQVQRGSGGGQRVVPQKVSVPKGP